MKKALLLFWMLTCSILVFAQSKYTLSGYIKDGSSGEDLIGANVYVKTDQVIGTATNVYGFFSMTLPAGIYDVTFSYIGYEDQVKTIDLNSDQRINVSLKQGEILEEVVIKEERNDANIQSTDMGTVELNIEQIKTIPVLFGEVDILKTIQLLPGVGGAGEGNTGFYVRGGGPDQNLILLDEAVVYNTGH